MEQENKNTIPKSEGIGTPGNKIVQTYAEDMAKVIQDDKSGLIKKIIHGEEEHEKEKRKLSPESMKNKFFMILGLVFILVGLATLSYFFIFREKVPTVEIQQQFIPIVFIDKSSFLEVKDFKKEEISQTILNVVNSTEVKKGGVEGIYFTENKQIMGLRRFITLIKSSFAPSSNPLFVSDNFLTGVVNGETQDFFILLKVRAIADVFDALRAWEGKMFFDLNEFFGFNVIPEVRYLLTKEWEDGIIQNKNARILRDVNNNIVLMYILADDNSVVITNTETAGKEIMLRLAASQIKK